MPFVKGRMDLAATPACLLRGVPMKVIVPVKRVIDYNVKVRIKADCTGVDLDNVKMSMNPFDEVAVEQALRLREAGLAEEVIAVSIGVRKAQETLRVALAMGADRAILVVGTEDPSEDIEPLAVAKLLAKIVSEEGASLVILGKQAIDNDCNATGQMLAAILGWGQATFASGFEIADGQAKVTREVDGGLETVAIPLPAVVSADLRLNEPRFPTLPNIINAKKKPMLEKTPEEYGIDISPRLEVLKVGPPPERKAGEMVADSRELVTKLREEAGVL